jgi:hypothetical protein
MAKYDGIDFILIYLGLGPGSEEILASAIDSIIETKRNLSKPIVIALRYNYVPQMGKLAFDLQTSCAEGGIPVFSSIDRAARAINRFVRSSSPGHKQVCPLL